MADDERTGTPDPAPDPAPDPRNPQVAGWLAVDPLDDVTRRRLVSSAVREAPAGTPHAPARRRWIAAAAAVVLVAVGGLALLTADGGHDTEQAVTPPRTPTAADASGPLASGKSAATPDVGDFGDLGDPGNLAALRAALASGTAESLGRDSGDRSAGASAESSTGQQSLPPCPGLPEGTVLAFGHGTLDGRPALVVLTEAPDGARSFDAVLQDPCEVRHLS
jgi:hypothetical protein